MFVFQYALLLLMFSIMCVFFVALLFFIITMIILMIFEFDLILWIRIQLFKLRLLLFPRTIDFITILILPRILRELALEKYTIDRFMNDLFDCNFRVYQIDDDKKYGILYNVGFRTDVMTVVQVRNSTAEPDGTYKTYYLRVPPTIRTAKAAVAWTFGIPSWEYNPTIET